MSSFKHGQIGSNRLDTNRLVSIMSVRQSLSPTAQAALKAGLSMEGQRARISQEGDNPGLSGPSFNPFVAQLITGRKE